MTTDPIGIEEREARNNHGTCWVMQVAAFARLTGKRSFSRSAAIASGRSLVPGQVAADGSCPLETARTKPYGYSLFNLDAMATHGLAPLDALPTTCGASSGRTGAACAARSRENHGAEFIRDKGKWPFPPDVMYADQWPMQAAEPSLRRRRVRRDELPGAVEDVTRRLVGGRGRPQLLRPPAASSGCRSHRSLVRRLPRSFLLSLSFRGPSSGVLVIPRSFVWPGDEESADPPADSSGPVQPGPSE